MLTWLVRASLFSLSFSAVFVGVLIFMAGPNFTAEIFSEIISFLGRQDTYSGDLTSPNINSEMRFYSVFLVAYGVVVSLTATRTPIVGKQLYLVLALLFIGGVGRLVAGFVAGWPDALFVILMYIELIFPVLTVVIYWFSKPTKFRLASK